MAERTRVLVVDDDANMRRMISCMLDSAGYETQSAFDADDALFALRARPFDAVLCELHMPRRDGFSLVRSVPRVRPGTPVVLMSSFGGVDSRGEAERAGAGGFLTKPFSSFRLFDAISRARRKR